MLRIRRVMWMVALSVCVTGAAADWPADGLLALEQPITSAVQENQVGIGGEIYRLDEGLKIVWEDGTAATIERLVPGVMVRMMHMDNGVLYQVQIVQSAQGVRP